nr:restriction endonuclease subunit S [Ruminococcus sp. AM34-10LB]
MKSNYKKLGQFIRQVDVRNTDGKEENLLGVSVQKQFIPSIANTVGTDFRKYKVVKKGQFTYIPDTSRRGDKIGIALLEDYDEGLVSNVYTVFEIIDEKQLIPEYLMLWFSRPEFDRYARFKSHGSVREVMDWDEMCKVELPVPSYEKQKEIVDNYKAIKDRIALKQKINDNLEATAQALYTSWFIDFEPFELDDDGFPLGWKKHTLNDKLTTSTQSVNPQKMPAEFVWHYSIPAFDAEKLPVNDETQSILSNKYIVPNDALLVSKLNPDTKRIWRTLSCFENAICSTEFIVFSSKQPSHRDFYYLLFNSKEFVDFLVSNATGSTNSRMRVKPASSLDYEFICPDDKTIDSFCSKVKPLLDEIESNYLEIRNLNELLPLAVAKMMSSSR